MTLADPTALDDDLDAYLSPPDGISESAADLWRRVIDDLEADDLMPSPPERALLVEAVRVLTTVDEMVEQIAADGLTVPGPGGRPAAHPLTGPVDSARRTLALLLKQLGQADRATSSARNGLAKHGRS